MQTQWDLCLKDIEAGHLAQAFFDCNQVLGIGLAAVGNINVYNIREKCTFPPLCYDLSPISKFLNQQTVRDALGVGDRHWSSCNMQVYAPFETKDFWTSYRSDIPKVLEKHPVLIYNGNLDLIVDFYGTSAMLNNMHWPGRLGFISSKNTTWHNAMDGSVAGSSRTYDKLTYVVVNNAGHMVPHDQPKNALDLLERFLKNQPFN